MTKNIYYNPSQHEFAPSWFIIDAKDQVLGKVAAKVATILMGKHEAVYTPHLDNGHRVIIINAAHLAIQDRKLQQKTYWRHTGYPGGIRSEKLATLFVNKPTEVLRKAIKGMLPKNKMGNSQLTKVYIYPHEVHEQVAQKPQALTV